MAGSLFNPAFKSSVNQKFREKRFAFFLSRDDFDSYDGLFKGLGSDLLGDSFNSMASADIFLSRQLLISIPERTFMRRIHRFGR